MAGIYDFLRDEYDKAKKAFGLIGGIKLKNDPGVKELSDFERNLYEKSLIYQSMKDAFTAPGRAYRGELDPYSPEAVGEALNVAGMAQLGGIPGGARRPGELGMTVWHGSPHKFDKFDMSKIGLPPAEPMRPVNHLGEPIPPTQYEQAIEEARIDAWKNHGLPENNTAIDRARAMGFDTYVMHGAKDGNQSALVASRGGELGPGSYVTRDGNLASEFAHDAYGAQFPEGSGVYPLVTKSLVEIPRKEWVKKRAGKFDDLQRENGGEWSGEFYNQGHEMMMQDAEHAGFSGYYTPGIGGENQGVVFNPKNIRSRFAAFNMSKRDSADLLATLGAPVGSAALLAALLAKPDEAQAK